MAAIRLEWSPHSGWLVIPGEDIAESSPEPFSIDGLTLIDPSLFRQASINFDWPRLSHNDWRAKITSAIFDKEVSNLDCVPLAVVSQAALLSLNLFERDISLEQYFESMESLTR